MSQVTTADITKLRKLTGAGMMDCKNALTESEGNIEKAIEIIRKKGQAVAMKRSDRETSEGVVVVKISNDNRQAAMIALACETDFVAKTDGFIQLANTIGEVAIASKPANLDALKQIKVNNLTITELILDKVASTGEKTDVVYYELVSAEQIVSYIHQGSKIGVIVGFNKMISDIQIGKDIAMQIAAMNPIAIDKSDVSPQMVEKEIEIGKEQARTEGKPEAMLEKIAMGKLNKFYNDSTLLNQEFIKDNKSTVRQYLQSKDKELAISIFKRCSLVM
jgi:elongation factor Ts